MKRLVVVALLFSTLSQAHIEGRVPEGRVPEVQALSCYSLAARATWGAYAQTLGAPAQFKFVSYAHLRAMFFGTKADVPTDGIYMLEDMNASERAEYQRQAMFGYKWAMDEAIAKTLDHEQLMAVFVDQLCRLTEETK